MEIDNRFGHMLYALGNCVFIIAPEAVFRLLTGEPIDVQKDVVKRLPFEDKVREIKLMDDQVIINAGKQTKVLNRETFSTVSEFEIPLDDDCFVR